MPFFLLGSGRNLYLLEKSAYGRATGAIVFTLYLRIFVYFMRFGMEFRRPFRAAVWMCILLCVSDDVDFDQIVSTWQVNSSLPRNVLYFFAFLNLFRGS